LILIQAVLLLLFLMNERKLKSSRPSLSRDRFPYDPNLKVFDFHGLPLRWQWQMERSKIGQQKFCIIGCILDIHPIGPLAIVFTFFSFSEFGPEKESCVSKLHLHLIFLQSRYDEDLLSPNIPLRSNKRYCVCCGF